MTWSVGRVVRHGSAKPSTPVQFRHGPHIHLNGDEKMDKGSLFLYGWYSEKHAAVVELVDTRDLKSLDLNSRVGSSPTRGTQKVSKREKHLLPLDFVSGL